MNISIRTIDKEIARRQAAVAKERDKLDEVIGDMEALRESCEDAWNHLQDARDSLSELV